jgi:hypothetical protein
MATQNVVTVWLTLFLRIREFPYSSIGPEAGSPERFRGFPQVLQANVGIVAYN